MRNIYLFNPENDLAVAHGKKRYDAPKAARRLASDMSLLPLWYADRSANSLILTDSDIPIDYRNDLFEALKINAKWSAFGKYVYSSEDVFCPWGWSPALADRLEHLAGRRLSLPDLSLYRQFSGRQFAVSVLQELQEMKVLDASVQIPVIASSLSSLSQTVSMFGTPCLMKSPWSGSGRGLLWVRDGWTDSVAAWCNNILKRQGEVVCEPCYEKIQDFAMEFKVENSQLKFVGYSYFQTDDMGTYRGNLLASDSHIEKLLSAWIPLDELHTIRKVLMDLLSERLVDQYDGYFGIDMMICKSSDRYFLHPCVELNLRFNMGLVSHALFENYIQSTAVGSYVIMHGRNSEELRTFSAQMGKDHPLVISNAKIEKGFCPLTYIGDDSEFMAYCLIE